MLLLCYFAKSVVLEKKNTMPGKVDKPTQNMALQGISEQENFMIKVLSICHGNICRSVSAQYIMEDLAKKNGVDLYVSSAATSREEIGNDIYPPAKRKLKEKGIPFSRHYARQATMSDYLSYDYLICMDENNMRNLNRMFNNDPDHKIYKLLSRDVSDPWYSNDFETAYNDINEGCKAWLEKLS